jgi:hypothetical protein
VYKARDWIPWSIEIGHDYPGFADEIAQLLAAGYHEQLALKLTVGSGDTDRRIFAAGDATDLPVEQGGLGSQSPDTAAAGIAHLAGAAEAPTPLRPVIRGMLLTGRDPLYLAAHLIAGRGWLAQILDKPPWPVDEKVVAEELGPYLDDLNVQGRSRRPASSVLEPRDTERIHRSVRGWRVRTGGRNWLCRQRAASAPRMG